MNILLAHGSSDSRHATQAQQLTDRAAEELGEAIELRFLNSEMMPEGAKVLPLLLGEGWHAKVDLKKLSEVSICTMLPALSARSIPIACMASDLAKGAISGNSSAVFAVYHIEGFETIAKALHGLSTRFDDLSVVEMHQSPNVSDQLQQWKERENIIVQPIALFEGRTMESVRRSVEQSESDAVVGPVLSSHIAFPAFIADCFRESHAT